MIIMNARITFWKLQTKATFVFCLFNVSLSFQAQSANKMCLQIAMFNFGKSYRSFSKED